MPPTFNPHGGPEDIGKQHIFGGIPPGMMPMAKIDPPQLPAGPLGVVFDGNQFGPPPFSGNNGGHAGAGHPPFGDFGPGRGAGQRGGWRGRGGPQFGGRGGNRGGFREGPPGT